MLIINKEINLYPINAYYVIGSGIEENSQDEDKFPDNKTNKKSS